MPQLPPSERTEALVYAVLDGLQGERSFEPERLYRMARHKPDPVGRDPGERVDPLQDLLCGDG